MKQLSIEEKAKAYDEALGKARRYYDEYKTRDNILYVEDIEDMFPELKESEGERIRKWLIYYFKEVCDNVSEKEKKGVIAWLEKQGEQTEAQAENNLPSFDEAQGTIIVERQCEQKSAEEYNITSIGSKSVQDKLREMIKNPKPIDDVLEQKPANNAEPKFKVGDWVVNNNGEPQVSQVIARSWPDSKIKRAENDLESFINTKTLDKQYHLWTIQDAKDGDVLISEQIAILFKKVEEDSNYNFVIAHAGIDVTGKLQITDGHWLISNYTHPATKEQRDTLIKTMADAGYEWNAEKKELKKVESITTWSEEDEQMINHIVYDIESLKEHVYCISLCDEEITWLKSLKERYTWKPSDEQMEALLYEVNAWDENSTNGQNLNSLYQDLKKLREE